MSGGENEIRERRGKSPDFPWTDETLSGTDKEDVKEHDSGEDEAVVGDTRPWGSKGDAADVDQEPSIEGPPKEPDAGSDDTEKARARKKTGPSF
jgi:hypothetical protein